MTYTNAILQLIQENPGISASDITERLSLQGRHIESSIMPYVRRGQILVTKRSIGGSRKLVTFTAAPGTSCHPQPAKPGAYTRWSPEDIALLTELYPTHGKSLIAARLNKSAEQIEAKARRLKLRKTVQYMLSDLPKSLGQSPWTEDEISLLRTRYPNEPVANIAAALGRRESQVQAKATKLGLRKSDEFRRICAEQLIAQGAKTRFNNTTRVVNRPALPVGSERHWRGYLYVKIALPNTWLRKHQLVWRQRHGDYDSKTHVLWFRDRNQLNCNIENLELITQPERLRRVSFNQYPPDLQQIIVLNNKLKRRLREQH